MRSPAGSHCSGRQIPLSRLSSGWRTSAQRRAIRSSRLKCSSAAATCCASPTTGAIVGTRLYYIANSQADRLDSDNRLSPAAVAPAPLTVVRVIELESQE